MKLISENAMSCVHYRTMDLRRERLHSDFKYSHSCYTTACHTSAPRNPYFEANSACNFHLHSREDRIASRFNNCSEYRARICDPENTMEGKPAFSTFPFFEIYPRDWKDFYKYFFLLSFPHPFFLNYLRGRSGVEELVKST